MPVRDYIDTTTSPGAVKDTHILIAKPAYLKRLWGKNHNAGIMYLHFVDAAALPANGAVTHKLAPLELAAGAVFDVDFSTDPIMFDTGICIYLSSTQVDKTIAVASDLLATLHYRARA